MGSKKSWLVAALAVVLLLASVLAVAGQERTVETVLGVEIRYTWVGIDIWRKPVEMINRSEETRYVVGNMLEPNQAAVYVTQDLQEALIVEDVLRGAEPYAPVAMFVMPAGSRVKTTRDYTDMSGGAQYWVNGEMRN